MQSLAFFGTLTCFAAAAVVFASCDTGGEPPELDGGFDGPLGDGVTQDDTKADSKPIEAASDGGVDGSCGVVGSACCTGDENPPCTSGATCTDKVCQPKGCGILGNSCCVGDASPCQSGATCDDLEGGASICTPCGTPGNSCCPLNACDDGGCCVNGTCAGQGSSCAGSTCTSGSCGACGGVGSPCCGSGYCTASGTYCKGFVAGMDAGEGGGGGTGSQGECTTCGGAGAVCCEGACGPSLVCESDRCRNVASADAG